MNFCKNCNFMLYTKLEKNGYNLTNYCKNCGLEVNHSKDTSVNKCVYKKNYSNDYLAENAFANKYTKYDPTLPRINNILCVNPKCLTNLNSHTNYPKYDPTKSIFLSKINDLQFTEEEIQKILSSNQEEHYEFNDTFNDNHLLIITFKDTKNLEEFKTNLEKMPDYEFSNPSKEIEREIIFIKYDYVNLKYLYLCSTCNTSWNNE